MSVMTQPRILIPLFAVLSAIYVSIRYWQPFDFDWLVKVLPLSLLVIFWLNSQKSTRPKVLLTALLFSLAGDVLLSQKGLFLVGLGSFLIAQICYAALFFQQMTWQTKRIPLLLGLLVYLTVVASIVVPHTGDLAVAIVAYMCAISTMVALAYLRQAEHWKWVAVGASFFILSDSLIAINKFTDALAGYEALTGAMIMATYYAAQGLIVMGYLFQNRESESMVYTS